ncbi:hypothetical protein Tco_0014623 [Tanacetum coccineum]
MNIHPIMVKPCRRLTRPQRNKDQYAVSRENQYAVFKIWNQYNILEDIKRGPYSKKYPIRRIQLLDTPREKEQKRSSNGIQFHRRQRVDPDLLTKDIIGYKTYEDYKDDRIYKWNKDVPWVDEKPWTDAGIWTKPTPVKHTCKPFNYKTGCSEWPTCGWKDDGYCNGGNLPGAYIIGNQLHYQDYEWYEALEDCKLKDEALRNKAIMEGSIKEDDDESRYEQKRQWNTYTNYDDAYEINHEHNKSEELCEIQEQPVCNIRRYMMIKYSFNDDEEYVAIKEDEYDDLIVTRKEACRAYQEIFHIMDEGWMVTRAE